MSAHAKAEADTPALVWGRDQLDRLCELLTADGYVVVGPAVTAGTVRMQPVSSTGDFPTGVRTRAGAGSYVLEQRDGDSLFAYAAAADGVKRWVHPPERVLWRAAREDRNLVFTEGESASERFAFVGMRPCDVAALRILERALSGAVSQPESEETRESGHLIVVANCTEPTDVCFCALMGTGPRCTGMYDLALTEMEDAALPGTYSYLVTIGSSRGKQLAGRIGGRVAEADEIERSHLATDAAAAMMTTRGNPEHIREALYDRYEHSAWDDIAARCLSCGNCTQVCPTCFCTTAVNTVDLEGQCAACARAWDSCFTDAFSYIHGGSVRPTIRSRYRQWLMHKFATWYDQFGTSGCVGCGRCIAWCPVGIDLRQELGHLDVLKHAQEP